MTHYGLDLNLYILGACVYLIAVVLKQGSSFPLLHDSKTCRCRKELILNIAQTGTTVTLSNLIGQRCWQTVKLFHSVGHQSILCTNKAYWQIPLTDVQLALIQIIIQTIKSV